MGARTSNSWRGASLRFSDRSGGRRNGCWSSGAGVLHELDARCLTRGTADRWRIRGNDGFRHSGRLMSARAAQSRPYGNGHVAPSPAVRSRESHEGFGSTAESGRRWKWEGGRFGARNDKPLARRRSRKLFADRFGRQYQAVSISAPSKGQGALSRRWLPPNSVERSSPLPQSEIARWVSRPQAHLKALGAVLDESLAWTFQRRYPLVLFVTVTLRVSGSTVQTRESPRWTLRTVATPTGTVVRREGESGLLR
jgi:hypothetical protein